MGKKAAVIGTFDTKGQEFLLLIEKLKEAGVEAVTIDTGFGENDFIHANYYVAKILREEGLVTDDIKCAGKRALLLEIIANRAAQIVTELKESGEVQGAISMGGGQGSFIAGIVMKNLPVGFPKVLLSTIALVESSAKQFKHLNDTLVMNSLVDIAGINSLLIMTITEAAGALSGMLNFQYGFETNDRKPAIGISAWGVTTPCVNMVRGMLEAEGIEVYVFHSNGDGGMILENLIRQGALCAVADITLSEISMPLAGANVSPVPNRLENAGTARIPQVIVPGGLDMVLASGEERKSGGKFSGRIVYQHNPDVAFVRSSKDENIIFGKVIANKLNKTKGAVKLLLPLKGISAIDKEDEVFYAPEIDAELFAALKSNLANEDVKIEEIEEHINSHNFAEKIVEALKEIVPELSNIEFRKEQERET